MPSRRVKQGVLTLSLAAAATLAPALARAQARDAAALKLACVQASDKAQQLRVSGKLVAASAALKTCVQDACPNVVREACAQWLGEVNASLPSIVIGAKDSDGKDLLDLKVSIDGELVTEHLGGRALPIDPGRHKMRYEKQDGAVVEEEILVGEGTKNRQVAVAFPGAEGATSGTGGASAGGSTPGATTSKGPSTANTVIGSVLAAGGAGALIGALALDLSATSSIHALEATHCAPNCNGSEVNSDELDYDLAGVFVGVGIVAVGVATYVFLAHPFGTPRTDASAAKTSSGPTFQVIPSRHGGAFAITF
jgi:hypothetical protein